MLINWDSLLRPSAFRRPPSASFLRQNGCFSASASSWTTFVSLRLCSVRCACVSGTAVTASRRNGNVLSWQKTPLKVSESYVLANGYHSKGVRARAGGRGPPGYAPFSYATSSYLSISIWSSLCLVVISTLLRLYVAHLAQIWSPDTPVAPVARQLGQPDVQCRLRVIWAFFKSFPAWDFTKKAFA